MGTIDQSMSFIQSTSIKRKRPPHEHGAAIDPLFKKQNQTNQFII